jgi:hypothetical protein
VERVRLIYEQIEEARKYLEGGSLLQLRLALILLDNAAELLMYRELCHKFSWDDALGPKGEPGRTEWIQAGLGPTYTREERIDSEREFEPKLRILQFRLKRISEDERKILRVCHKLRCEAFHRVHIRSGILVRVCKLLYLTVADLTIKLPLKFYSIPGGNLSDENAAFMERFGLKSPYGLGTEEESGRLRNKLVENIPFDPAQFAQILSDDLVERIDSTIDGLAYVGGTDDRSRIDHNLQHTQFWRELGANMLKSGVYEPRLGEEFKAWQATGRAKFTLSKLDRWRRVALAIGRSTNPASALDHYWAIDKRFSPLEQDVAEAVWRYDDDINTRIHNGRYPSFRRSHHVCSSGS